MPVAEAKGPRSPERAQQMVNQPGDDTSCGAPSGLGAAWDLLFPGLICCAPLGHEDRLLQETVFRIPPKANVSCVLAPPRECEQRSAQGSGSFRHNVASLGQPRPLAWAGLGSSLRDCHCGRSIRCPTPSPFWKETWFPRMIHGDPARRVHRASDLPGTSALVERWPRWHAGNRRLPLATMHQGLGRA
jgi:hypothetical protein